jgi:hypothetical protein
MDQVRATIAKIGSTEINAISNNEGLREMWDQKQVLLAEMSRAKKQAADDAAKPYLTQIAELETSYAMMLQLSANPD